MKNNKHLNLFWVLMVIGCHSKNLQTSSNPVWKKKAILGYALELPPNYSVFYSNDSSRVTITNRSVTIDFIHGYSLVDGLTKAKNIVNTDKIGSFKKIILDTTENHITSIEAIMWDTTNLTHLLNDNRYMGCNLTVDNLNDSQKDTVLKIFNSLSPGNVPKAMRRPKR